MLGSKNKSPHGYEALEAIVNAGFEITVSIRPLDLLNT